jgi:hypothetical protein
VKLIACTLGLRDLAAQRARWQALTIEAREEAPDGIRVTFAPGAEGELLELIAVENECCAWAQWSVEGTVLTVSSSGDGIAAAQQLFANR